ncbi:MAG: DUF3095 family protein [Pseudobdellovibrionaceae bacterium]
MVSSYNFFADLPVLAADGALCSLADYSVVPRDWYIAVEDVRGSTRAIEEGRYKDVNMVASSAIVAVLNKVSRKHIAYIFGGDGATIIFPPEVLHEVCCALLSAQKMAQSGFYLDLRTGVVPVKSLLDSDASLSVAKIAVSDIAYQAALAGDGVSIAEKWVKDDILNKAYQLNVYLLPEEMGREPEPDDFKGLQCRWEPLYSQRGTNLSLMVQARSIGYGDQSVLYREILAKIVEICGEPAQWRPAFPSNMHLTLNPRRMMSEYKTRTAAYARWKKIVVFFVMYIGTCLAVVAMAYKFSMGRFNGAHYAQNAATHSDFIKFDNTLRMVMDVSLNQKEAIELLLRGYEREGRIFYGLYTSKAALMTCMVFDPATDHFHFIDGDDGGYSFAAKLMKEQIKLLA